MARKFRRVVTLGLAVAICAAAHGADPAVEKPLRKGLLGKRAVASESSPEFENVRKALDALTPEQRKRFQENFARWSNLTPGEKIILRDREEVRKRRMAEEIEAAIKDTGVTLDNDRRALFAKRYGEERRKVEEQLRRESEEKRRPLVQEIVGRLKTEFASPPPDPVAPAGATTP